MVRNLWEICRKQKIFRALAKEIGMRNRVTNKLGLTLSFSSEVVSILLFSSNLGLNINVCVLCSKFNIK